MYLPYTETIIMCDAGYEAGLKKGSGSSLSHIRYKSVTNPLHILTGCDAASPRYVSSLVDDVKTETHKLELLRLEQQKVLSQVTQR